MFEINNNTVTEAAEAAITRFEINSEKDFIQKCFIKNLEVEDGNYGKQVKLTVCKGGATASQWICANPEGDKELPNGKILTKEAQINDVTLKLGSICQLFSDDFNLSGATLEEVVESVINSTKDKWETTEVNVKFELKNGFVNPSKYYPFVEKIGVEESKLKTTKKDREALAEYLNVTPDIEDTSLDGSGDIDNMFGTEDDKEDLAF